MTHRIILGWNEIEKTLNIATKRISQRTDLTKHSVFFDNYTGYVNTCFSDQKISEMIAHVVSLIHAKVPICNDFLSQWHKDMFILNILKDGVKQCTPLKVKSYMAILEYQIIVHGIYIETFMNKKWRLTRDNIHSKNTILKSTLAYFKEWKY